jgi:hypothetical protein
VKLTISRFLGFFFVAPYLGVLDLGSIGIGIRDKETSYFRPTKKSTNEKKDCCQSQGQSSHLLIFSGWHNEGVISSPYQTIITINLSR